jgi:hypothetical protein
MPRPARAEALVVIAVFDLEDHSTADPLAHGRRQQRAAALLAAGLVSDIVRRAAHPVPGQRPAEGGGRTRHDLDAHRVLRAHRTAGEKSDHPGRIQRQTQKPLDLPRRGSGPFVGALAGHQGQRRFARRGHDQPRAADRAEEFETHAVGRQDRDRQTEAALGSGPLRLTPEQGPISPRRRGWERCLGFRNAGSCAGAREQDERRRTKPEKRRSRPKPADHGVTFWPPCAFRIFLRTRSGSSCPRCSAACHSRSASW